MRGHLRFLDQYKTVNIADMITAFPHHVRNCFQDDLRVYTFPLGVRIREPVSQIPQCQSTEDRFCHRMCQRVCVTVSQKSFLKRDLNTAEYQFPSFSKTMNIS